MQTKKRGIEALTMLKTASQVLGWDNKRTTTFQEEFTLEQRTKESKQVRSKHPDRIPVICERAKSCSSEIPSIDKRKYLVPYDLTVGQFLYVIRRRISIGPEHAMFLFVKNELPPTGASIRMIDAKSGSKDGFLYMTYSGENTFGAERD